VSKQGKSSPKEPVKPGKQATTFGIIATDNEGTLTTKKRAEASLTEPRWTGGFSHSHLFQGIVAENGIIFHPFHCHRE
jgi:hypothetical protein